MFFPYVLLQVLWYFEGLAKLFITDINDLLQAEYKV